LLRKPTIGQREGERENRAAARGIGNFNGPAVHFHDLSHDSQTETGALTFRALAAPKSIEDPPAAPIRNA